MKKLSRFFITGLLMFFVSTLQAAQNTPVEEIIKEGISQVNRARIIYDKDLFLKALDTFGRALSLDSTNVLALYYQTYCKYRLLEMSSQKGNAYLFDLYYEDALAKAEKLPAIDAIGSERNTLLAAIYMQKIANNPMSGVTLSGEIHSLLAEAEKMNKNNPRLYIIRGIMKFQMPAMFGGSIEGAAKDFNKAVSICEKQESTNPLAPNWGYLEALTWFGISQFRLENYEAAKFAYQKALTKEPDYTWLKNVLLPRLEEKMKEKK